MHILIISTLDDAHIPFVTKHLPPSVTYTVVDPFGAIGKKDVSYIFEDNTEHIYYGDKLLDNVDSVWFRKPTQLDKANVSMSSFYQLYSHGALRRHIAPLYRHWKTAFWVSPYEAIISGENKPYQLEVAAKIGFTIPDTLITGDADRARAFVGKHGTCVIKSQAVEFPRGKTLMTTAISAKSNITYEGLSIDPMIFQQLIEPAYELRITVVGQDIFAAKIVSADQGPFRDWRYGHIDHSFTAEATTISTDLQEKCRQLTQKLKLHYGAIDLIVDRQGVIWFLEINPNGQWAFIEEATDQQIGKAMAKLLTSSKASG